MGAAVIHPPEAMQGRLDRAVAIRLLDRLYRAFAFLGVTFLTIGVPFVFQRKATSAALTLIMLAVVAAVWRIARRGQPERSLQLFAGFMWLMLVGLVFLGLPPTSSAVAMSLAVMLAVVVAPRTGLVYGTSYLLAWAAYLLLDHAGLAQFHHFPGSASVHWFVGAFTMWIVLLPITELVDNLRAALTAARDEAATRRQADQSVRKASLYARSLIEASLDPLVTINREGKITDVNQATESVTGCSRTELVGSDFSDYFTEPDMARAGYQEVFTRGKVTDYPLVIRHVSGRVTDVLYNAAVYRNEAGEVEGVFAAARDVTERKRAEQLLKAEELRFRDFSNSTADWFWEMDAELRFSYFSDNFERNYGLPPDGVLGKTRAELLAIDDLNSRSTLEAHVAVLNQRLPFRNFEYRIRVASGAIQWFSISGVPYFNLDGGFAGYRGTGQNITERKQMQLELERHRNELQQLVEERTKDLAMAKDAAETASRAKSTFLANMSHELRTPMHAIMGMTDIVLRRSTDPKQVAQLNKVKQASTHLLSVINDILDISKIEAERLKLEQIRFKFGLILENLTSMVGQKAAEKGLKLFVELSPEIARRSLLGDPLRLGQILLNLVSNAVKFTAQGAITVRVRTLEDDTDDVLLRCEVQDSGIGISQEEQKRLFVTFEQGDGSMTRKYGGTGLGLAISKRLVQMMGGEVGVESTLGQGSTFWFTARLGKAADDAVSPTPTPAEQSAEVQLKTRYFGTRILLAEDEPINQEVSRGLLEGVGLTVELAEDGGAAVAMAQRSHYDLILMDMQMPQMNGVEATRVIRALPGYAKTPILAMTANAFDEDRQVCLDAGMNDHIGKPAVPEALYETLLKWLSESNA